MNTHHVLQSHIQQGLAELGIVALGSVGNHGRSKNAIDDSLPDLFCGDERLGAEHDLVGNTGLAAPFGVFAPGLRQVEFVDDGQAGGYRADGEADGDLAVVLFTDLAAVLPGDADGVFAFLGETGIIDDPGGDGRTGGHLRKNVLADSLEEKLVIPGRYGDDGMQGLVSALGLRRAAMGSTLLRSPGRSRPRQ